jgi:multiple antibiotic resistance protein
MLYVTYFFKTLISILFIMGPFSVGPVLMSLTVGLKPQMKKKIVLKACVTSFSVLLVFSFIGTYIFQLFGITIPAFRIAGGILILIMSLSMLHARQTGVKQTEEERLEGFKKEDISIFPIAIPLISGPGAITTVILLTSEIINIFQWIFFILALFISSILCYFILRGSEKVTNSLGKTGVNIITRIMGLILSAIAVQYVIDGIVDVVKYVK